MRTKNGIIKKGREGERRYKGREIYRKEKKGKGDI